MNYTNFEGPDRTPISDVFKTKSKIKVELTSREVHMLYDWYDSADEELHLANSKNQLTDKQLTQHIELYDKLRAAKMDFFIGYNKQNK